MELAAVENKIDLEFGLPSAPRLPPWPDDRSHDELRNQVALLHAEVTEWKRRYCELMDLARVELDDPGWPASRING